MPRSAPHSPHHSKSRVADAAALWVGWAGLAALALVLGHQVRINPRVFLPDELGHLVIAREAWRHPELIFSTFGRTANTLMFMPVAGGPLWLARAWACAMTLAATGLAWSVARRAGLRLASLVPWFVLLQPQVLQFGWGALTEVTLSLALMVMVWLAASGRWRWAALAAGLLPLIRHEAIVPAAGLVALCLMRRDWLAPALAALPIAAVNILARATTGRWPFMIFLAPRQTEFYGSGLVRDYWGMLIGSTGLALFMLAALGTAASARRPIVALLAFWSGLYFLTEAFIYRFGLYASGGHALYLESLAPALAVLGAAGCEAFLALAAEACMAGRPAWAALGFGSSAARLIRLPDPARLRRYAAVGLVLLVALSGPLPWMTMPQTPHPETDATLRALDFLRRQGLADRPIVSVDPLFYYVTGRPLPNTDDNLWINARPLASFPAGTIVLWDRYLGNVLGLPESELRAPENDWRNLWETPGVAVFEKK